MTLLASSIITLSTVIKLVVSALVAGVGVTIAFSSLIYFVERAAQSQRAARRGSARAFQAASVAALLACVGIVAYGLVLMASKPK